MTARAGILDASLGPPPADLTTEVCVVGSGSGGATAARVLAEAGREVVVLEEGGDFTGRRLTQRDAEMYDQLYMDRGGRATDDLSITVLQGRVLGGGGVINASDVVPIPEGVLDHWVRRFGLTGFAPAQVAPYAGLALADLSATPIPEHRVNRANQLLRVGARSLGWRGEIMRHNRQGCAGLGTCFLGCPLDAKRNPRFVAIPAAIAAGARFFTRARAVRIEDAGQELKRVVVRTLDTKGYHERGTFAVRARVVVLAANAVASAQLLLRSGVGNAHVGRHLMLQPQLPLVAVFDERIEGFYGIPQAYALTEFEDEHDPRFGLWGFRVEPVMGTPGLVASLLPFFGEQGRAMMRLYPHIAASLLLVPDEPSGTVGVTASGRPVVGYDHKDNHQQRLREAIRVGARAYLAAGARRVIVPTTPALELRSEADLAGVDALGFPPASAPLISAHQQGGVRFATSERAGAAAPDGRVYGTRDVYVFDSSGFPSSASSHTMTPIITVSRLLSAALAARLG